MLDDPCMERAPSMITEDIVVWSLLLKSTKKPCLEAARLLLMVSIKAPVRASGLTNSLGSSRRANTNASYITIVAKRLRDRRRSGLAAGSIHVHAATSHRLSSVLFKTRCHTRIFSTANKIKPLSMLMPHFQENGLGASGPGNRLLPVRAFLPSFSFR
jgi:hypothetical protein